MKRFESNRIGLVLSVVLLAVGTVYLARSIYKERRISHALEAATQKLALLARNDPALTAQNIEAARNEAARMADFLAQLKEHFAARSRPKQLDSISFRKYLESTRATRVAEARRAGTELPHDYWFSFDAQKGAMNFDPAALPLLGAQVADIRMLSETAFDAHANRLIWLRRAPIDGHDNPQSQDCLASSPLTNTWTTSLPYMLSFDGFSPELAAVLETLNRSGQCLVVSNLTVEPAPQPGGAPVLAASTEASSALDYYRRYHLPFSELSAVPVARPEGARSMLEEKPLRFTLLVESVQLR
jgi:hypothetical protein